MILNAGNLALATVFAVVSIWGMNLNNRDEDQYALFVVVSLTSYLGAFTLYLEAEACLFTGDSDLLLWSHAVLWCAYGVVHLVQDCQQSVHCLL